MSSPKLLGGVRVRKCIYLCLKNVCMWIVHCTCHLAHHSYTKLNLCFYSYRGEIQR